MGDSRARTALADGELIRALKALADPTRFRMVQEIAEADELSCSEVAERFNLSQPTISHHLKILFDAGLLVQRPDGKHHYTSINRPLLEAIAAVLPSRLTSTTKKKLARRA